MPSWFSSLRDTALLKRAVIALERLADAAELQAGGRGTFRGRDEGPGIATGEVLNQSDEDFARLEELELRKRAGSGGGVPLDLDLESEFLDEQ